MSFDSCATAGRTPLASRQGMPCEPMARGHPVFTRALALPKAKKLVNGEETTYSNTQIRVGDAEHPGTLNITSGGDTTMRGASTSADRITTDIGGNLLIESLKDKIKYDSQQTSGGGGVSICVPPICYGQMVAVNVNAAESKIKADHDSVGAEDEAAQRGQSGLKAGNGGFDVKVGGNTTLIGGVITSTDQAVNDNKNSFTTGGTLTTQDIQNQSELDAYSVSASISTGSGSTGGSFGYGEVSDNQSSVTKAGISGIAGNQLARTGDAEAGIKPVFTEADADKINTSLSVQTGITAAFGQNAAKVVGDIAANKMKPIVDAKAYEEIRAKELNGEALSPAEQFQLALLEKGGMTDAIAQSNLTNPDLLQDYENWKEGGAYRVGLHVIAGAMGGGVNGAIGAGVSAAAAPLLDDMQEKMTQSLIESGMNPETARATASLIAVGTAAAVGGLASGGIQGATTAANIDLNNRQLHPDEQKWLLRKAKEFAQQEKISEQEAMERLTQQALRQVDYLWRAELADGDDAVAKAFLADTKQTFTNDLGEQQKLFTTSGQQLFRPEMFADIANPTFYKQFAQSGISRTLTAGLAKELRDSGIDLKNGAIDLAKAIKENPGAALNAVWNALKGVPQGIVDSFKDTGTAIGEGAAVALNEDLQAKLNSIYGTDVASAQRTVLAIRITAAITGASTAAKGAKAGIDASVGAGRRALDTIESEALEKAAIEKAKINNNFYSEGSAMDFPRELRTSSGVVIQANPDKTTTVLGTFRADTTDILGNLGYVKSTLISGPPAPGSFNLLNVPDDIVATLKPGTFWEIYNKPFLDAAIQRGDDIALATKPELRFLKRTDGSLTGFGREMQYLESKGFAYDSVTGFMRKTGGQ